MSEPLPAVGQGRRPPVARPWPRLPRWFWLGLAAAGLAFVVVGAIAVVAVTSFEEQPLYERRSPPLPGEQSHRVGRVTLPEAELRPVRCGSVDGLKVQGGPEAGALLADAVGGLCRRINAIQPYGPELAERIVTLARRGTVVSFANFGRTGELSASVPGRVLISDSFLRGGGQFKGFLLPELAHELWHAGNLDPSAEDELLARKVEAAVCGIVPSQAAFRGCTDAKRIAADPNALAGLRKAGYR